MFRHFSVDDDIGSLKPLHGGLFTKFPSWVALVLAMPFLLLFVVTLVSTRGFVLPLLFGASASLFLVLWHFSRKLSKRAGLIRIFRKSGDVSVIQRDGTEHVGHFGTFRRIRINKVISLQGYVWWAFLEGDKAELPLSAVFTFRRLLIRKVSPIAEWLRIPVELSNCSHEIDFVATFRENKTVIKGS